MPQRNLTDGGAPKTPGSGRTYLQVVLDKYGRQAYDNATKEYNKQIASHKASYDKATGEYNAARDTLNKQIADNKAALAKANAADKAQKAQAAQYAKVHPLRTTGPNNMGPGVGFGAPMQRTTSVRSVTPSLHPRRRL